MKTTLELQKTLNDTKNALTGYDRRHFMAGIVETIFDGNAAMAKRELGWNRKTIHNALKEYRGQFCFIPQYHHRGRKRAEEHLPNLLTDIQELAEQFSQTDPTFRTTRQYTRLTTASVRQKLIDEKGYNTNELPVEETIRLKLNQLGYTMKRVKKVYL